MSNADIVIHRGTHQIGGVATEIRTDKARIIVDVGDELCFNQEDVSRPLEIDGVTNEVGNCDAVLFTHYHSDHIGQFHRIRKDIPMYMGKLAKEIFMASHHFDEHSHKLLAESINTFQALEKLYFKDIIVTPFLVDHSASDAYMFLIEAGGKRILHTGDFRLHGFRGKGMLPTLAKYIGKVDVIITEGTNLGLTEPTALTEYALQQKLRKYINEYKYVFLLCSSTNLERVCSAMHSVPRNKYFVCDDYQYELLDIIEAAWGEKSRLYKKNQCVKYGINILDRLERKGFLMCVRENYIFSEIMQHFPKEDSIVLYSMWDGYLDQPESTLPDFLKNWHWEKLHTSGHADVEGICEVIDAVDADIIIPIHTECGEILYSKYGKRVKLLEDGNTMSLKM